MSGNICDSMLETQCQWPNISDWMIVTQYQRLNIRGSILQTHDRRLNIGNLISETQCQKFTARVRFTTPVMHLECTWTPGYTNWYWCTMSKGISCIQFSIPTLLQSDQHRFSDHLQHQGSGSTFSMVQYHCFWPWRICELANSIRHVVVPKYRLLTRLERFHIIMRVTEESWWLLIGYYSHQGNGDWSEFIVKYCIWCIWTCSRCIATHTHSDKYVNTCAQGNVTTNVHRVVNGLHIKVRTVWWNGGVRSPRAHHQHSATPSLVKQWSKTAEGPSSTPHWTSCSIQRNWWEKSVFAQGVYEAGESMWYIPAVRILAIVWIYKTSERASETKAGKDRVWNSLYDRMMLSLLTVGSPEYILHWSVHPRYQCISVPLHRPVPLCHPCISLHLLSLSPLPSGVAVVVRNAFACHNSSLALCAKHTAPLPSHITVYPNPKELQNLIFPTLKEHRNNINPKERT